MFRFGNVLSCTFMICIYVYFWGCITIQLEYVISKMSIIKKFYFHSTKHKKFTVREDIGKF